MGAFNYVEAEAVCPTCRSKALIRIQIHTASSFDGPETRCCLRTYQLGEKMYWWPEEAPQYDDWREDCSFKSRELRADYDERDACMELAFSECLGCGESELLALVEFEKLRPVAVVGVFKRGDYDLETGEHFL